MKFLIQKTLMLFLIGITTAEVFAHAGTHDMTILDEAIHYITSSFHIGPVIGVISAVLAVRIYRKWSS